MKTQVTKTQTLIVYEYGRSLPLEFCYSFQVLDSGSGRIEEYSFLKVYSGKISDEKIAGFLGIPTSWITVVRAKKGKRV